MNCEPRGSNRRDRWRPRRPCRRRVFALLWVWFAVTAVAELWHVVAWRLRSRPYGSHHCRPAPRVGCGNSSVRRCDRRLGHGDLRHSRPRVGADRSDRSRGIDGDGRVAHAVVDHVRRRRRHNRGRAGSGDAVLAGSVGGRHRLRERDHRLQSAATRPEGDAWQGGVFPAGMDVVLPDEELVDARRCGPAHEVVRGDSYWQIADDHLTAALHRDATPAGGARVHRGAGVVQPSAARPRRSDVDRPG